MQENRFASYVAELGGLSEKEYDLVLQACRDSIYFQLTFLPHRKPILPANWPVWVSASPEKPRRSNRTCRSGPTAWSSP